MNSIWLIHASAFQGTEKPVTYLMSMAYWVKKIARLTEEQSGLVIFFDIEEHYKIGGLLLIELNTVYNEDCLEGMKRIQDESIDMILCDLPYEKTKNKWDTMIPFKPLWEQYERVIKPTGAIVLFGQDKFTAKLMLSNEKLHRRA